jgi:hypothetical protein
MAIAAAGTTTREALHQLRHIYLSPNAGFLVVFLSRRSADRVHEPRSASLRENRNVPRISEPGGSFLTFVPDLAPGSSLSFGWVLMHRAASHQAASHLSRLMTRP